MSEGFECDRCGTTHSGSPDTMLLLGDGRARSRNTITHREEEEFRANQRVGEVEMDLCRGCRNDLRAWWSNGGGSVDEFEWRDGE